MWIISCCASFKSLWANSSKEHSLYEYKCPGTNRVIGCRLRNCSWQNGIPVFYFVFFPSCSWIYRQGADLLLCFSSDETLDHHSSKKMCNGKINILESLPQAEIRRNHVPHLRNISSRRKWNEIQTCRYHSMANAGYSWCLCWVHFGSRTSIDILENEFMSSIFAGPALWIGSVYVHLYKLGLITVMINQFID